MSSPRRVPCWDEYFLALAACVAIRSKDPATQIGAVLADSNHHLAGSGYNGAPAGVWDDSLDWSRPAKYTWVIHAEANAILHATRADLADCTLYVTGRPCPTCMRLIAGKRIRRVVHGDTPIACVDQDAWAESLRIAHIAGITLCQQRCPRVSIDWSPVIMEGDPPDADPNCPGPAAGRLHLAGSACAETPAEATFEHP